jgi:general secretion pathway protein G
MMRWSPSSDGYVGRSPRPGIGPFVAEGTRAGLGTARRSARARIHGGFTLIELLVTVAILGIVALTAMPMVEIVTVKQREQELRQALRTIRTALDAHKAAADAGLLPKAAGESGYPATLDMLTQPLDVAAARPGSAAAAGQAPQRLVFLRQLPRDPFHPDPHTPAAQTWDTRSYASRPDEPQPGPDVFDIASRSPRMALDGTPYARW